MRRKTWLAVLGAAGLMLFGTVAFLTLRSGEPSWESADEFVLYSVDGRDEGPRERKPMPSTGDTVAGYPVLGKVMVGDPGERRRLADAFAAAVSDKPPFKCFWPRHAVRVRHGGRTADYVICFECSYLREYLNGARVSRKASHIDPAARPAFDAPLLAAGVPIAPD